MCRCREISNTRDSGLEKERVMICRQITKDVRRHRRWRGPGTRMQRRLLDFKPGIDIAVSQGGRDIFEHGDSLPRRDENGKGS